MSADYLPRRKKALPLVLANPGAEPLLEGGPWSAVEKDALDRAMAGRDVDTMEAADWNVTGWLL